MSALLRWDMSKYQWHGPVIGFEATVVPTQDEIIKHFLLPKLEDKQKAPLLFESADGEKLSANIFYLEKGSENMKLWGWNTDIRRGVLGISARKCCIEIHPSGTAIVKYEEEHNQMVWDILLRQSDWQL